MCGPHVCYVQAFHVSCHGILPIPLLKDLCLHVIDVASASTTGVLRRWSWAEAPTGRVVLFLLKGRGGFPEKVTSEVGPKQ
jgi:hypothetical protein